MYLSPMTLAPSVPQWPTPLSHRHMPPMPPGWHPSRCRCALQPLQSPCSPPARSKTPLRGCKHTMLLSFVFLGLFQFAELFSPRIGLAHAAARAARARAVGFNRFLVEKTARVATIPVAGTRLTPSDADLGITDDLTVDAGTIGMTIDRALSMSAASPTANAELARGPEY